MDLIGATLEDKFSVHSLSGAASESELIGVALRYARVNHACLPNTSAMYDETALVAILCALRDIHPGEEITICYYSPFFKLVPYFSCLGPLIPEPSCIEEKISYFRNFLTAMHGITCPSDCS